MAKSPLSWDTAPPVSSGYAMSALPYGTDVPWHRVINHKGEISPRAGGGEAEQRALLEAEGIRFDERGRTDLGRFGWAGLGTEVIPLN